MQLCLTLEELELLTSILREDDRLSREAPSGLQIAADNCLRDKLLIGGDALRRSLSRNLQLDYDELQELADSLNRHKKTLTTQICTSPDQKSKPVLERSRVVLQQLLEKVTEACAVL